MSQIIENCLECCQIVVNRVKGGGPSSKRLCRPYAYDPKLRSYTTLCKLELCPRVPTKSWFQYQAALPLYYRSFTEPSQNLWKLLFLTLQRWEEDALQIGFGLSLLSLGAWCQHSTKRCSIIIYLLLMSIRKRDLNRCFRIFIGLTQNTWD